MSVNVALSHTQVNQTTHRQAPASVTKGEYKGIELQLSNGGILDASDVEEMAMARQGKKTDLNREQKKIETKKDQKALNIDDDTSDLSDSKEEAGMMASSKKSKADLNVKDKGQGAREFTYDKYQKLLSKLPDLQEETLADALMQLTNENNESAEEALNDYMKRFGDVSHKYTALMYAKENISKQLQNKQFVRALNPMLLGYISQVNRMLVTHIMDLLQDESAGVLAGINVSEIAQEFSNVMGQNSIQDLRDFYRTHIMHYISLWDAYEKMKRRFKSFKIAKQFMEKALAADLASDESSVEEDKLAYIMKDLKQFRTIDKLYQDTDGLFDMLAKSFMLPKRKKEPFIESTIGFFTESITRSSAQRKMDKMARSLSIKAITGQISLLNGVVNIIKTTPVSVFKNERERMRVIDALQEKLDTAINDEEKAIQEKRKKENKDVDEILVIRVML